MKNKNQKSSSGKWLGLSVWRNDERINTFWEKATFTNPAETETNELNVSQSKVKIKEEILLDEVRDEIKMEISDDNFSNWVQNKQHENTTHRIYHLSLAHMW